MIVEQMKRGSCTTRRRDRTRDITSAESTLGKATEHDGGGFRRCQVSCPVGGLHTHEGEYQHNTKRASLARFSSSCQYRRNAIPTIGARLEIAPGYSIQVGSIHAHTHTHAHSMIPVYRHRRDSTFQNTRIGPPRRCSRINIRASPNDAVTLTYSSRRSLVDSNARTIRQT